MVFHVQNWFHQVFLKRDWLNNIFHNMNGFIYNRGDNSLFKSFALNWFIYVASIFLHCEPGFHAFWPTVKSASRESFNFFLFYIFHITNLQTQHWQFLEGFVTFHYTIKLILWQSRNIHLQVKSPEPYSQYIWSIHCKQKMR